jgi:CRISPR-associated endonuclease Csy4
MDYYQEITLIDQAEISPYFLWSKIYMQLHFALVEMKDQYNQVPIGISFPDYV